MSVPGSWRRTAALAAAAVLVLVAAYEAALALDWVSIGSLPGEDAPGADLASDIGAVALLAALVVSVPGGYRGFGGLPASVLSLLPLSAAAAAAAAGFAYDPYYAPSLRRYSDAGGFPSPWWLLAIVAAALAAAALARSRPGLAVPLTRAVLLACLVTLVFRGLGK